MRIDDRAADRESESRAARLRRHERIEQRVADLGRDAGPVVLDADPHESRGVRRGADTNTIQDDDRRTRQPLASA